MGLSAQEYRILSTPAMQRLSRIKQLAHAYIVYPGAVHTRLEHSLGTLHVAGRICDRLNVREKRAVRLAALLHDVGQGPFSHLFEEIMRFVNGEDFGHQHVTKLIMEYDEPVRRALGKLRGEILQLFDGDSLASDVVSSRLDADKMDYLRRDSYHAGVAYGYFDLERVLNTICRIKESDRYYIGIEEKGRDSLESYRLARYLMHGQVYEHHARLIADDMFARAVTMSIADGSLSKECFDLRNPGPFLPKYMEFDDHSIEHLILREGSETAQQLIADVRARRLLKRAYVLDMRHIADPIKKGKLITMDKRDIEKKEMKISDEVGLARGYVIIHLQSMKIKLYERFEQTLGGKEPPILILKRDGSVTSLDEESPISADMDPIRRLFVFCPKQHTSKVKEIAEDMFGAKSEY